MTNKEAIKFLKEPRTWEWLNVAQQIAIDMAIDALSKEPCEDAISRAEALKAINKMDIPEDMSTFEIKSHIGVEIGTLPSVQPKIKTGHWILTKEDNNLPFPTKWYKCSECGKEICEPTPKFCDECGAKIIGIKDKAEK